MHSDTGESCWGFCLRLERSRITCLSYYGEDPLFCDGCLSATDKRVYNLYGEVDGHRRCYCQIVDVLVYSSTFLY
ncbi:hypothetical protein OUZ56_019498 [Daphnia magna]|uniref:Uncharacterized protein n=1 Tax=Daphnia magna TaxID=35525 RepID=A0ABQ9ZBQ9_9CRUS|nr:hypothetical protein OUZ56_019498 [Daphnia magna]